MADPSGLHPTAEEICCPLQADVQGSWRCWAKDEGWTSKMAAAFSNMAGWESPINEALMGKTWITSDVQLPCLITVPESRSENDEKPLEVWAIPVLFTAKIPRSIKGWCWSHSTQALFDSLPSRCFYMIIPYNCPVNSWDIPLPCCMTRG